MVDKKNQRGLGRGLSALLADVNIAHESTETEPTNIDPSFIDIDRIQPNPDQPRRRFNEESLEELTRSISTKGVIQPLIVRQIAGKYEIVAGERRWRAAQRANIHKVPVLIREYSDVEVLEIAIIENIQRQELNAVEEAEAFQQLMTRYGHTQEALASALGKSRSHIANMLRLNNLSDGVKALLRDDKISMGHARALLSAPNAEDLAKKVAAQALSVRETEALVRKALYPNTAKAKKAKKQKDTNTEILEQDISATLGLKTVIEHQENGAGKVTIQYKNLEDLDRLIAVLNS